MGERFDKLLGYVITLVIFFYGLPLLSAAIQLPIYNLLPMFNMVIAMIIGFMYGKKHGGDWLICVITMLVFVPCIYMFYNPSVWLFVIIYGVASFIGLIIGTVFKNRIR